MKKYFLIAALCFVAVFACAQKPKKKDATAEVQLNFQTGAAAVSVFSPDVKGRYFIKDDIALRMLIGISSLTQDTGFAENPDGSGNIGKAEISSSETRIAFGIEKHLKGTERLSPYFGAQFFFSWATLNEVSLNNTDGVSYVPNLIWNINPGTTNKFAGIALLGVDYYFINNVYLGIEVSWGYYSSSTGQGKQTITTAGGTAEATTPETSSHGFGTTANPGLRLGFVF